MNWLSRLADVNGQDLGAGIRVSLIEGLESREFAAAGIAPGGPEVDEDQISAQARKTQRAAVIQARQIEIGRALIEQFAADDRRGRGRRGAILGH